jgi:hypothetical protein
MGHSLDQNRSDPLNEKFRLYIGWSGILKFYQAFTVNSEIFANLLIQDEFKVPKLRSYLNF